MAQTQVISCPRCKSRIRVSVRDDGEVTVLGSEEVDPLEDLREI